MEFQNLSILVTGGAGFIGSNIAEYLLNHGAKMVRIVDNLSTGSKDNIKHLLSSFNNLEFVWGDVSNLETCRKSCKGMSLICHQAALGSVPRSIDDPISSHNSNVNGFLNILVAAKENNIKRIVYASSSSVYGTNNNQIKMEGEEGIPLSPYAATKHVNEIYANVFSNIYGLECIGLRYFNVFGPRQNPNGVYAAVIPKFIETLIQNGQVIINGDGNYSRDFTYVDNIVYANCLALCTNNDKCFGEVFNVGTHGNVTINELVYLIQKLLNNTESKPIYGPKRRGDVPYSRASIQKINELLGYSPLVLFDKGLEMTVQYYLNQHLTKK